MNLQNKSKILMCEKKTILELKNLFMSEWFTNPKDKNRYANYFYMQTFRALRFLNGTFFN